MHDVIILGAGMAGASLAAELAAHRRVALVEIEAQPGRHATGRSAAMFFESYGNATIRALTRASRSLLEVPPADFCEHALMTPRETIVVASQESLPHLEQIRHLPDARFTPLSGEQARRRVPILREEWLRGALLDDSGRDIDVAALHQAYLRRARRAGAQMVFDAGEVAIERSASLWQVRSRAGTQCAPLLVNACGAWADAVAQQAGARALGLAPLRRSVALLPPPEGFDVARWPAVVAADETFYFKPDAGQLLLSPANEDPSLPCDAVPDELDIAIAVDRFQTATTAPVSRITHRWAGLRTFAADRTPVVGFDPRAEGFFWLAGQGGYGIQTAPALARTAASLLLGSGVPADVAEQGVTASALSPARGGLG